MAMTTAAATDCFATARQACCRHESGGCAASREVPTGAGESPSREHPRWVGEGRARLILHAIPFPRLRLAARSKGPPGWQRPLRPGSAPGIPVFRAAETGPGHDEGGPRSADEHVLTLFLTADASLAIGGSVLFPEGRAREASQEAGAGHGLAEGLATFWREAQAVRRACPQPQARLPPRSPA